MSLVEIASRPSASQAARLQFSIRWPKCMLTLEEDQMPKPRDTGRFTAADLDAKISERMWRVSAGHGRATDMGEVTWLMRDRADQLVPHFLRPGRKPGRAA